MFDLFRSRDKAVRYLLGGLLLLVALSMVTYLIPGYGTNSTFNPDTAVLADVAGEKITALSAQRKFQQVTRGTDIPPELMDVYLPQFIDNMILQRAAVYEAERLGLSVNDDEVLNGMILSNPQFFPNGQLASKDQLEQYYAQQGQTLEDALEDMRKQLILRKLQNTLFETTFVSPKEVEQEYIRKYEKAKVQYIAFPPAKFRDQVKLLDDEVRRYFDNNRSVYTKPAAYTFDVLIVDQAKVEQTISVTDAQLRQAYSASMDNFRMPERVHARHILFKTDGRPDAEKKSLMNKALDLEKQLKAGADFADLAKKNSDDAADKGGDLGWLVRGQTVPEFEQAAFALKAKEISQPVTSQFGIHIIQVLEHEPAHVKPFEEVKDDLAKEVRQRTVADKVQQLTAQLHTELLKRPGESADVAKQYGVEVVHVKDGVPGTAIPTLGVSPEVDGVLPGLDPGKISEILSLPSDRLAIVAMEGKQPARNMEFDEAQSRVRDILLTERANALAETKAKEAAERLNKGEDINAVAKSYKLDVTTSSDFSINDSVEGLGTAQYLQEAFSKPVGTVIGPTVMQGRSVVAKVISKTPASLEGLAAERDLILKDLKQKKAQERNDLMLDSILAQLTNDGKVKVYREEIQRLIASYRRQK
jgi:peptidyl-prolyl cis-trans isomerase D